MLSDEIREGGRGASANLMEGFGETERQVLMSRFELVLENDLRFWDLFSLSLIPAPELRESLYEALISIVMSSRASVADYDPNTITLPEAMEMALRQQSSSEKSEGSGPETRSRRTPREKEGARKHPRGKR